MCVCVCFSFFVAKGMQFKALALAVKLIARKRVPKRGYLSSWGIEVVLEWPSGGPGAGPAPGPPEGSLSTTLVLHELRYR